MAILTLALAACGDDADTSHPDATTATDATAADAAPSQDTGTAPDGSPGTSDLVARGKYLVDHVALCGDCHTPRLPSGAPDMDAYLAGNPCFIDLDPSSDSAGCLPTTNLTNHTTGLADMSDAQVKAMILDGVDPDGSAVIPVMPYWVYHNMTAEDADAVLAYLRTVPGVDRSVGEPQKPWAAPPAPATPIDPSDIPSPDPGDPNLESAARGRYLAAMAGMCLECHTPELDPASHPARPADMTKPFAGGRVFPGIPSPPFTASQSVSSNLTQHATGLDGWTAADVKKALTDGIDDEGAGLCAPMPSGPMGAYAGLTEQDATDIANYIMTLPGIDHTIADTCSLPPS